VNIEGVRPARSGSRVPVLADIYLGKIKKWNEKPIADLNPSLKLPDELITVVRRSDGSGTTFIFTDYLSKVSPEWKQKVARAPRCPGRKASAARATKASPPTCSGSRARSATSSTRTPSEQDGARRAAERDGQFVQPRRRHVPGRRRVRRLEERAGFYQILTDQPGRPAGRSPARASS
jgi:phosphate transport system substrate-binding protein